VSLITPDKTVQKLQSSLQAKAKSEADFKFYSLWDKIYRIDVLTVAYRQCRRNGGSPGIDKMTFQEIEAKGLEKWIASLQQELRLGSYIPSPLRRVWIPKQNGQLRPLGIPTIKDRVVQTAVVLVIGPIFDTDLLPMQYGYRPGLDAKMALRRVYFHITQHHRTEVLDADLSDYFNTIPHGPLMKSVARRISDGRVLKLIKMWLEVPVIEENRKNKMRTTIGKDTHRGTPQGGVISPLLANIYFRRFLLAWEKFGFQKRWNTGTVNFADDFVILTRPGSGNAVYNAMTELMVKLGLTVNIDKTRVVDVAKGNFDFLGYTFGYSHGKAGRRYLGSRPSKRSVQKVIRKIHDETSRRWTGAETEARIKVINTILRGWCNYFDQGPVLPAYKIVQKHCLARVRRLLVKKHRQIGKGVMRYSDEYLFNDLGLFKLPTTMAEVASAKA
jgi:RNA-directed DNA polymerase